MDDLPAGDQEVPRKDLELGLREYGMPPQALAGDDATSATLRNNELVLRTIAKHDRSLDHLKGFAERRPVPAGR